MKEIYPIDSNGYIIWTSSLYRFEPNDYQCIENEVDIPIPRDIMFIRPRWDGKKWVEGGKLPEPVEPTPSAEQFLGQQITDLEISDIIQGQQITELELKTLIMEVNVNVR